jgi:hypothetical protein
MLSGFNGEYKHQLGDKAKSIWRMPEHTYLGINIRPTVIEFDKHYNRWVLRSDDGWSQTFYSKCSPSHELPLGEWNGILVSDRDEGSFANALAFWPVGGGLLAVGGLIYTGFKLAPMAVALIADWSARQVPLGGAFLMGAGIFIFMRVIS